MAKENLKSRVPEQIDLNFPEKGISVDQTTSEDLAKKFGLGEQDFSCPQCEIGGGACPKHPNK